jgi:hypothetical protein
MVADCNARPLGDKTVHRQNFRSEDREMLMRTFLPPTTASTLPVPSRWIMVFPLHPADGITSVVEPAHGALVAGGLWVVDWSMRSPSCANEPDDRRDEAKAKDGSGDDVAHLP